MLLHSRSAERLDGTPTINCISIAECTLNCCIFDRVAPEVLLDEDVGYTFKADNWRYVFRRFHLDMNPICFNVCYFYSSFAIVMWEMIADSFQNPFIGMAPIKFYNQTIHSGKRPPVPEGVDKQYLDLITDCWKSNASERPAFDEIVTRLEKISLDMGASIDLPPTFQGGYHQGLAAE